MASQHQSKRMVSVLVSSLVLLAGVGLYFHLMLPGDDLSGTGVFDSTQAQPLPDEVEKALQVDDRGLSKAIVNLQTTRGKIQFKFYSLDAPKTVHRIVQLIRSGFYNGLTFHRVEPGFVIQGGDPTGTGSGGSGMTLPAEFNSRKHVAGAVAMARGSDPDSADSQFYITLGNPFDLDGKYTVFGQVVAGQEVTTQIQPGDRMTSVTLDLQ